MKLKRSLSMLLAVIMLFAALPIGTVNVSAENYSNYYYSVYDGEVVITDCYSSIYDDGEVEIPSFINGYPVTSVGDYSFQGCYIESVIIPEGVKSIGEYAFRSCYKLNMVTIPKSVTNIGEYAFDNCDKLEKVYYNGTCEEWNNIVIGEYNNCLKNANIIFLGEHSFNGWCERTPATCFQNGEEYFICSDCGVEITKVIPTTAHDITSYWYIGKVPTCTEEGYEERWSECIYCGETWMDEKYIIPALGHDIIYWEFIEPTCTKDGYYRFECSRCVSFGGIEDRVIIPALGHDWRIAEGVEPTFDQEGYTEYIYCGRCGIEEEQPQPIPRKQEKVSFRYEAEGINGSNTAVNSGYIKLNIYMNVETEIARLYGLDFALNFGDNITLTSVDGGAFDVFDYTSLNNANKNRKIILSQGIGFSLDKTFDQGEYLFATLTFKVDSDFTGGNIEFSYLENSGTFARDEEVFENEMVMDFDASASIEVITLGDPDNNGIINSKDVLSFAKWFTYADIDEYNTVLDLNKDGYIDGDDYYLLRRAVVGEFDYLD